MGDEVRDTEDHLLIERCLAGEEAAFERLVERYYARIDRLAQQIVRQPMAAEDIAQECFLRAYRSLSRFRGEASFYSWLYRITINLCLNDLRRHAHQRSTAQEAQALAPSSVDDPSQLLEHQDRARLVRRAIDQLPDHYRVAVILRDLEGLSYQDIAEMLGVPLGTVKSRLNAAKHLLHNALRPLLDEDAG